MKVIVKMILMTYDLSMLTIIHESEKVSTPKHVCVARGHARPAPSRRAAEACARIPVVRHYTFTRFQPPWLKR